MQDVIRALRPGSRSWLSWLSALVLVVGLTLVVTRALDVWGGSSGTKAVTVKPATTAPRTTASSHEKTVPLEQAARAVARRFLLTAVARRHLAESYDLVGAALRQGMTRTQWATGNIPIIPYPVTEKSFVPLSVDFSYENHALLEVTLMPDAGHAATKAQQFFLELRAYGKGKAKHWLVVGWVPHAAPIVPIGGN
jgi:hypothetical protein